MAEIWQALIASPAVRTYGVLGAVLLAFMVLERFFPAEPGQPGANRFLTAEFTLLYFLITPLVVLLPMRLAQSVKEATGGSLFAINLDALDTGSPPVDGLLHYVLFPTVPFIVFDFFYYWHHRLQHVVPALWEQHKLHHMDESVYCVSSGRHHWLEEAIRVFTIVIPMAFLLTLGSSKGWLVAIICTQWAIFIHINVRLPFGPLTPVLVGPQLHRIHHSRDPRHVNKNMAAFLPLWDILFGTYCPPRPGEWAATGLPTREVPKGVWDGVVMPFRAWFPALAARGRQAMSAVARLLG